MKDVARPIRERVIVVERVCALVSLYAAAATLRGDHRNKLVSALVMQLVHPGNQNAFYAQPNPMLGLLIAFPSGPAFRCGSRMYPVRHLDLIL